MAKATSIRLLPNPKLEIEFTTGVWTDVTADIYQDIAPTQSRYGRTNDFDQAQPADFSVTLLNDGSEGRVPNRYTPQNTASPYYPNIKRRKRIRFSINPGTQRILFFGYIKAWQPQLIGQTPIMVITAKDRGDQFQRFKMLSPIAQEITLDKPLLWWPLTDASSSTQALEQSGNGAPSLGISGTGTAVTFGDNGAGFGDGPGVKFQAGQYLAGNVPAMSSLGTVEVWANTTSATDGTVLSLSQPGLAQTIDLVIKGATNSGKPSLVGWSPFTITGSAAVNDGGWHHFVITQFGTTWTLYVDGVSVGTGTGAPWSAFAGTHIRVGEADPGSTSAKFTGNISQVATYAAAMATRVPVHTAAGKGYSGDTTDQRIARWLGYAGLTSSDWNLDPGQVTVNTYPQAGVDVYTACQDMATTEGGGSVFYVTPDGKARFVNRRYRDTRTPKLTLVAQDDLDPTIYQPSLDDANLVTQVNVSRSSSSGAQTTQTYSSGASDVFAKQVTTYTVSDLDALALAQSIVNGQLNEVLRFPQLAVDLTDAGNNHYDDIAQLQVGDRIRLSVIPANVYPVSQLDVYLEGWAPVSAVDSYQWVANTSVADNPGARFQLDLSTVDGPDVLAL